MCDMMHPVVLAEISRREGKKEKGVEVFDEFKSFKLFQ